MKKKNNKNSFRIDIFPIENAFTNSLKRKWSRVHRDVMEIIFGCRNTYINKINTIV
jgi:hypothetical protein